MSAGSRVPPVRAVSLGGWLVVEGWIHPSLFDGIPNKDLLDGTELTFQSAKTKNYLTADHGGGGLIVAEESDATKASYFGTFRLWRINKNHFNLRVAQEQFMGLSKDDHTVIVAEAKKPEETEIFEIHRINNKVIGELIRVRIKASNGFFLQVRSKTLVTADYKGGEDGDEWGDDNPSVFFMTINTVLKGEYQLTNGYGPDHAPKVMKEHWENFIVEEDFKFISENGLNTVRIPVGWWTAYDPPQYHHHHDHHHHHPPKPYVAGSLHFLDKAFDWAEKYGIKVLVDLHAAPGSQSGWEPSSSRDGEEDWEPDNPYMLSKHSHGFHEWANDDKNIEKSIKVIEFFAKRYGNRTGLLGVELLNEPRKPYVTLDVLKSYYKRAYEAVRKHSEDAYVVMCDRLGLYGVQDPFELVDFAKTLHRSVIDVHYYNLYEPKFKNFTVQENIDYIIKNRAKELIELRERGELIERREKGAHVFVGEWVAEWHVKHATKEDYQTFAQVQIGVYGGEASFGWGYWTLKNVNPHWSMEWMIKNGYIKLPPL